MATHHGEVFEGLVVSRQNYKERDMLVKILTDRFGYKTFFVRGVRKRGFKMGAAILPFTRGTYIGNINDEGLSFLTAPRGLQQYQAISEDIALNAYATYILALAERAFGSDNILPGLWFEKIIEAIWLIDTGKDPAVVTNIIEVQLLAAFGVAPQLTGCAVCQKTSRPFDYSESYGGLLCPQHYHLDPHRLHLDQRTIYYLQAFSVLDLKKLGKVELRTETKQRLRQTLDLIYDHQVGIYLKAKKFLDQMDLFAGMFQPLPKKDPKVDDG